MADPVFGGKRRLELIAQQKRGKADQLGKPVKKEEPKRAAAKKNDKKN